MSDETVPSRESSPFALSFRLLAIALGIMSAVLIAKDGFQVTLDEYFEAVLAVYDDALALIVSLVFNPVLEMMFAKLREWFGWQLTLHPHAKHVFVLLWLYFRSIARAFVYAKTSFIYSVRGGVCALMGAVTAGSVSVSSWGVFLWALASLYANSLLKYPEDRRMLLETAARYKEDVGSTFQFLLRDLRSTVVIGLLAGSASLFLVPSSAPGLAALAIHIGLLALSGLWDGASEADALAESSGSWLEDVLGPVTTQGGLDILAVLGGAAFVVWLGRAPA